MQRKVTILLSPFLPGTIATQPGAAIHPWTAVLQLLILIGIVLVPVAVQAALSVWWVRRRLERSGQRDSQSFGWIFSHAFIAWIFFSSLEFAALFALAGIAKSEGYALGYIGFALLGLVILYTGFGLVIGVLAAAAIWRAQQRHV